MSSRLDRRRLSDAEWLMLAEHAMAVECPRCGAELGRPCVNILTGDRVGFPAHWQRIVAATRASSGR